MMKVFKISRVKQKDNHITNGHSPDNDGRIKITIYDKQYPVARLSAIMFLENNDKNNKNIFHHKDENPNNNHISNLMWVTASENTQFCVQNGKLKKIKKSIIQYNIPYLDTEGNIIMDKIKEFESTKLASNELNIGRTLITNNLCNNQHTAGGYVLLYSNKNFIKKI